MITNKEKTTKEKNKEITKEKELLKPKNDVVFHALFGEKNKELCGAMLSSILREDVKLLTTDLNRFVDIDKADEKFGILDYRAEFVGGTKCNIEIQISYQENEIKRFLCYLTNTYCRQLTPGTDYSELKKTVGILITDHEIPEFKDYLAPMLNFKFMNLEFSELLLTDDLHIVIIELVKVRKLYEKNKENKLLQWMMFLDNPNSSEVKNIMTENKDIEKSMDELRKVSGDEELRRVAELRESYYREVHSYKENGYSEGIKEGIREIAKELLKSGMKPKDVEKYTKLSRKEIEKIKFNQ